jgi:hypothetical protein
VGVATVTRLPVGGVSRGTRVGGRLRPLRLVLKAGDPAVDGPLGIASLEARVAGAQVPVRLSLSVNGEVVRTWAGPRGRFDLSLDEYGPGRHVVTARAVDGGRRRALASLVVVALDAARPDAGEAAGEVGLTAGPGPA